MSYTLKIYDLDLMTLELTQKPLDEFADLENYAKSRLGGV